MLPGDQQHLPDHGGIVGPGHEAVLQDTDNWLLVYHYYTSAGSRLGINFLDWSDGWPRAF